MKTLTAFLILLCCIVTASSCNSEQQEEARPDDIDSFCHCGNKVAPILNLAAQNPDELALTLEVANDKDPDYVDCQGFITAEMSNIDTAGIREMPVNQGKKELETRIRDLHDCSGWTDAIDAFYALRDSTEALRRSESSWALQHYVDDFGDATEDAYLSRTVSGTFSNSATTNSELNVKFLVEKGKVSIKLYEYGDNVVNGSQSYPDEYEIKVRNDQGETFEFKAENWSDRLNLGSSHSKRLITLLLESKSLRFSIREIDSYSVSSYRFDLPYANLINEHAEIL